MADQNPPSSNDDFKTSDLEALANELSKQEPARKPDPSEPHKSPAPVAAPKTSGKAPDNAAEDADDDDHEVTEEELERAFTGGDAKTEADEPEEAEEPEELEPDDATDDEEIESELEPEEAVTEDVRDAEVDAEDDAEVAEEPELPEEEPEESEVPDDELPEEADDEPRAPRGWLRVNDGTESLVKSFPFDDFAEALAFANKVGAVAEKMQHHPDILVSWGKTRITSTTHDAKGLTDKDFELAKAIEDLV